MRNGRIEVSSLSGRRAQRFGALYLKALFDRRRLKQVSVLHVRLEPGASAPALFHRRTHEFFYVLRGSVHGKIGGRRRRLKAGDYCFLPAGTVHEFTAGSRGLETLDVFFPRLDLRKPDVVLV